MKELRQIRMLRYFTFTFLGLILGFCVLITAPENSKITDSIGLASLMFGTGMFLKRIKLAGILTLSGLGTIVHVIGAWWYNLFYLGGSNSRILVIYIFVSACLITLVGLSIHSIIKEKALQKEVGELKIPTRVSGFLAILPIILYTIEIILVHKFFS